ncbi:winged helix DNA-binding domain-containing protein [Mucilaginibacter aquariorum]|uniref:Winged helix DNA-binding domain-containing protein n=1 Tax=Mucilaginibacter aquariorum TaxID=2967225 RepID=A0ABT1SYN3_9SPHI|nr:winged helix DNA-binding domain-containing protein [Mucilaginibacter aquariorum]MCQ6957367.1 winged helix DNA-binding domain-containing protein [Mucilaginibacter aquariorum]
MMDFDLSNLRLQNQHLAKPAFSNPADVVKYLGAVQSQDYTGAKWALGMRLINGTDDGIEQAFAKGDIIRTHVMRPTWHFVHPDDLRWMLDLTASRIQALAKGRHKQLEIDQAVLTKSENIISKALKGGNQIARDKLSALLKHNGINTDEQRFVHILMHLELEQSICSGGREGKQFTYALFDDRIPQSKKLDHDEAVVNLMERYFISHGPATLADFVWWSGLTITDARAGIDTLKDKFESYVFENNTYWFTGSHSSEKPAAAYLLPNYDEYIVSYKDRSFAINANDISKADPRGTIFNHTIILNGKIEGIWKRAIKKDTLEVELTPFKKLSQLNLKAIEKAAKDYAEFLQLKDVLIKQVS